MIENALYLVSAYGRKYSRSSEVQEDWDSGKDFKIIGGPYCSCRDTQAIKDKGYRAVIFKCGDLTVKLV